MRMGYRLVIEGHLLEPTLALRACLHKPPGSLSAELPKEGGRLRRQGEVLRSHRSYTPVRWHLGARG